MEKKTCKWCNKDIIESDGYINIITLIQVSLNYCNKECADKHYRTNRCFRYNIVLPDKITEDLINKRLKREENERNNNKSM